MHFPHTPEALLGRNDSKNPATTCKGITSSGRPCRRALASPNTRRKSHASALNGVVALVREDGAIQEADFYCWQHKDQAEQRVEQQQQEGSKGRRAKRRSTELFPLQERSSIDTLVQRLGIDAAAESPAADKKTRKDQRNPKPPRRTETADFGANRPAQAAPYAEKYNFVPPAQRQSRPKNNGFWASLCCMTGGDDDYVEIVRHRKRVEQTQPTEMSQTTSARPDNSLGATSKPNASTPARKPFKTAPAPSTPEQPGSMNSTTNRYISLIPKNLSPQTTSVLLAELVKPISPNDEDGYIYIFWLTPQSNAAPPESTARSLLSPGRQQHHRRISDVMTEYSYDGSETENETSKGLYGGAKKTIMLKIGRANNVTRRMNEWQRQCGYALNLVRWYPYVSSSGTPSPQLSPNRPSQSNSLYPDLTKPPTSRRQSDGVRKVPCVKRVERLIHLELAEKQVKRQCAHCGKEHREWFEVEATQEGVKSVDETVRRWVGWTEREAERV